MASSQVVNELLQALAGIGNTTSEYTSQINATLAFVTGGRQGIEVFSVPSLVIISFMILLILGVTTVISMLPSGKIRQFADTIAIRRDNGLVDWKSQSIIRNKRLLEDLFVAATNCNQMEFTAKCIEITTCNAQMVNAKYGAEELTPFHVVCQQGNYELIEFMLSKGADVNVLSKDGKRALHFALNHFLNHPEKTNFNVLDLIYKNEPESNKATNQKLLNKFLALAMDNSNGRGPFIEWLFARKSAKYKEEQRFTLSRSASLPPRL